MSGATGLSGASGRRRSGRGALVWFAFGLVYYGLLLGWLRQFGVIAWLPLVVSQAGYAALFGALLPALWRPARPVTSAFAAAALWTAADWARGAWPIGGFTWGGLGYTQHGNRLLLPLASVTGVWGVTFVVMLVNALALAALRAALGRGSGAPEGRWVRERWVRVAVPVGLAASAALLRALIPVPAANGRALDVAVVQGNVPVALASDRLLQTEVVWRSHVRLHRTLAADPPDLAVWAENSLDADPATDPRLGAAVSSAIRAVGAPTVVGALSPAPGGRFYNQALLYSGRGRIVARYTKVHLVPFGEYIPWHAVLGWTDRYRRGNGILAPGRGVRVMDVDGVRLGTPICFENTFPDLFRRFVASGAQVVVVTTNDSSFLFSPASAQHVVMSQLRAAETGRWVVQAAISGESAIVAPSGTVLARTRLFTSTVLRGTVGTSTARTPYVRFGDWFPWACGLAVLVVLAALAATALRRRRRGEPRREGERSARPLLPVAGTGRRTLVVLPTYEECETIERVLAGVLAADPGVEALVVDDGSPDGTGDLVEALAAGEPRVHLLRRPSKLGLASAYLEGFRRGLDEGFDLLVEMDSDLSHRPEDLPRLLEATARHDLVIGSRYVPGGGVSNWSRSRLAISRAGNAYARIVLGLPVADATSGYRAYRRGLVAQLVHGGIHSEGYAFQIELAYRSWRLGSSVGEVPITFQEREHGASKFSRRIVLEALLRVTEWGVRDRLLRPRRSRPGTTAPTPPGGADPARPGP